MTEPKIAQGPVKSMSTTPRESGNATGILPLWGGFRGFATAVDPAESAPPVRAGAPRPAILAASENGTAAMNPSAADVLSNSLRFIRNLLFNFENFRSLFRLWATSIV